MITKMWERGIVSELVNALDSQLREHPKNMYLQTLRVRAVCLLARNGILKHPNGGPWGANVKITGESLDENQNVLYRYSTDEDVSGDLL